MNVQITFRHMETSEAVQNHVRDKLTKLQKFLRQPMTAKVTLSLDNLERVAEAQISAGGVHHEAREKSADMHESIDKVVAKLERQIRGSKGAQQSKRRRSGATLRGGNEPVPISGAGAGEGEGSEE
jgi:putative sigma-54 modulation protein